MGSHSLQQYAMPIPSDTWTFKRFYTHMEQWDLSLTSSFLLLTIILVFATARRFYNLDEYGLWSDELWGVVACSQGSWWAMIENLIQHDSHPPGYQTLLYWWMKVFGNSDFSIRAPSAIAGIGMIVWTFELGRRQFSVMTGLIAAALVSGAFQAIYYSQEARAYSFLMCIAPAYTLYYLDLFVTRFPERARISLYGFWVTATLLLYFHYVGAVILACTGLIWLLHWRSQGYPGADLQLAVRAFGLPLLLYLPWLPVMVHHLVDAPAVWSTQIPDVQTVIDTYRFLLGPDNTRFYLCLICLGLLLVMRQTAWFTRSPSDNGNTRKQAWLVIFLLCTLPVLVFVIQAHISHSAYTLRHFTYTIPLFAVLIACLPALMARQISSMKWRSRYIIFILVFCSAINTYYNLDEQLYTHYKKEDYRGAVDIILHDKNFMKTTEEKIIVTNSDFFDHYIARSGIKSRADFYLSNPGQIDQLKALLQQKKASRFYYLEVNVQPKSAMQDTLTSQFSPRCFSRLNKVNVAKFLPQLVANSEADLKELHDCPLKRSLYPKRPQQARNDPSETATPQ